MFVIVFLLYAKLSQRKGGDRSSLGLLLFIFFLLWPVSIIIGVFGDLDQRYTMLMFRAFLFITLLPFASNYPEDFFVAFYRASLLYSCVFVVAIIDFYLPSNLILEQLEKSRNAGIGRRRYGTLFIPMIYLKSSSLLLLFMGMNLFFFSKSKKWRYLFVALLVILFLVFTATRANMFSAVALLLFFFWNRLSKSAKLIVLFLFFIFVIPSFFLKFKATFLSSGETSIQVKSSHVISYFTLFYEKPLILLFGQGMGQSFYTEGFKETVYITELMYFELVRYYGLPLTIIFLFSLIQPILRRDVPAIWTVTSIGYLLIAGTNPLLLSSTGFTAIMIIHSGAKCLVIQNGVIKSDIKMIVN